MKRKLLTLAILCFFTLRISAQTDTVTVQLRDIRTKKFHVDVELRNLFGGLSGAGFIFKRKIEPGRMVAINAISLLRFVGHFDVQKDIKDHGPTDSIGRFARPTDYSDIRLGIGFEQQYMNKGFVHYFGMDAIVNYYNARNELTTYRSGGLYTSYNYSWRNTSSKTIRAGLNPFFGVKYYFTDQLSLGIETGWEISYFTSTQSEYMEYRVITVTGEVVEYYLTKLPDEKFKGIISKFNNVRFLTAGYVF